MTAVQNNNNNSAPDPKNAPASKQSKSLGVFSYSFEHAGKGPTFWGFLLFIPVVLIAAIWAAFAPLSSAAIANGEVVLNRERKVVQHLEGGLVLDIFVKEGELIKKGQQILSVRDLPQRTKVNTLYDQLAGARALYQRLWAELHDLEKPDFSNVRQDIEISDEEYEKLVSLQNRLFEVRKASIEAKTRFIRSQQQQSRKEIEGLKAQLAASDKQHGLVSGELENISGLLEKGLALNSRKVSMQKVLAELEGDKGESIASIARVEQSISSADLKILEARNQFNKEILDELQKTKLSIQEMTHKLVSNKEQLRRSIVRAPASGRVLDLQIHTKGAVISPGQKLLDIVPQDDRLVIEARLHPNDIDIVERGTHAKIQLSAYKARKVPKIDGKVIDVSSDILTDKETGERYFATRILVDETIFPKLKDKIELYPGMPAQVFLIDADRTVADYLLLPITDAMYRAFREE